MQVDLQTIALKPLRNTFKHIEKRFGDKVASRYQEATYDLQPTDNFHYRPTWDPEREIHDVRRTKIVLKDWYVLKDPRQFTTVLTLKHVLVSKMRLKKVLTLLKSVA